MDGASSRELWFAERPVREADRDRSDVAHDTKDVAKSLPGTDEALPVANGGYAVRPLQLVL